MLIGMSLQIAAYEAPIRQSCRNSVGVLTWFVAVINAAGQQVNPYIGKLASVQHCMNKFAIAPVGKAPDNWPHQPPC